MHNCKEHFQPYMHHYFAFVNYISIILLILSNLTSLQDPVFVVIADDFLIKTHKKVSGGTIRMPSETFRFVLEYC